MIGDGKWIKEITNKCACGNATFNFIHEEEYDECREAIRLIYTRCGKEMDYMIRRD